MTPEKSESTISVLATVCKNFELVRIDTRICFSPFIGYDPNGDYTYTKAQHYGAEEWKLIADDTMSTGERAVVIFANFGKKYLAIRNGKLTGVSNKDKDCVWILD